VASTSVESLEDQIPFPHFHVGAGGRTSDSFSGATDVSTRDGKGGSAFYFVAMTALSRLIRRVDNIIDRYEPTLGETELLSQSANASGYIDASRSAPHSENYNGPPTKIIQELVYQLDLWRDTLPQKL
jgi:hypothetical protein